jgi:tRNA dimethylallyltransferase
MTSRTLHVLTGCTAVGKTDWALAWAEERGAEIVSCDSLLFYRGMDIGVAKPAAADRARVPHHLIDILDVTDAMDVTRYVVSAKRAADEIIARNRPVLVVGGSGFYLKAFFGPVADAVEVPGELRARIADRLAAEGLPALVAELRLRNPGGLGGLDTENPRRVARALERCLVSGKSVRELAEDFARQPGPFADYEVKLMRRDRSPDELNRRIEARVAAMLSAGLVEEVRGLLGAGLGQNPSAARAIGYREVIAMLEGRLASADLAAEIVKDTRALVKKQRTWFRTQLPAHEIVA